MKTKLVFRRFLLFCICLFLILLAWVALDGGVNQWPRSVSFGQQVETIIQIVFGLLCLLTVITCFWWRGWAKFIRLGWATSLVLTAGLSALVWGPSMPLIALAFAMVAFIVALGIIWALQRLCDE